MRFLRSHPILSAALLGVVAGILVTLGIEFGGAIHKNSNAVILSLWPVPGTPLNEGSFLRTALILFVEMVGNALGYALLFTVPTAAVVGIRRIVKLRRARATD